MLENRKCPRCEKDLPADAPQGLCPECLLKQAMRSGFGPGQARTTPYAAGFVPPSIEELAGRFPQLEILGLLGHGGMGIVYKARQSGLDRLVALKILPPQSGSDPAFAERFTREARALARLSHPGIVAVYDFGQTDGLYYFIMEFVDGMNLRHLLREARLTPAEAVKIVPQICDALQYAHDQNVVHRDIKPENLLLDKKGRVKIADFGLAKLLGQKTVDIGLTGSGQIMGTPHYMAPEQMEKPLEVDHRADIYSLGVVFYEMLTGELPLGRFDLPSRKVHVDVRLDEIVLRALERKPERRYQHASDVKTDVDSIALPSMSRTAELPTPRMGPSSFEGQAAPSAQQPLVVWILALLTLIIWPLFLVLAIPVSIWLWRIFRQPDGKKVFRERVARAESFLRTTARRYLCPVFCTTTGWAIILCFLGMVATFQPFLPLAELQIVDVRDRGVPIAQVFGYEFLFTNIDGMIFGTLLLLLVATSFIEPIPLWRSLLIILSGMAAIVALGWAVLSPDSSRLAYEVRPEHGSYTYVIFGKYVAIDYAIPGGEFRVGGKTTRIEMPGGRGLPPALTKVGIGPAAYIIVALSCCLLLLGTIQLRGVLRRRHTSINV